MELGGLELKKHQYRKGYTRSLEVKRVEWDGEIMLSICGNN